MNDILPGVSATWRHVESIVVEVIESYGYEEIRLPILEHTEIFARAIGEVTDIVEKEMYTFKDRNDSSLTLRPEYTTPINKQPRVFPVVESNHRHTPKFYHATVLQQYYSVYCVSKETPVKDKQQTSVIRSKTPIGRHSS